jgi:hypothetical protein
MWPFKDKCKSSKREFKPVLCIPGTWKDKIEIFSKTDGAYMIVGDILMDIRNKQHFEIEITNYDSKIRPSFDYAGRWSGFSEEYLNDVDKHNSVVYILGRSGDIKECTNLANVAAKLLKVGGIGVKVETTGKSFTKEQWIELSNNKSIGNLYKMFVADSILIKDGTVLSCGMHNLGFCDSIISGEDFQNAVKIISIFNLYQLVDLPVIKNGQTFQTEITSPYYKLKTESNQPFKGDDLFENPIGMWRLTRLK